MDGWGPRRRGCAKGGGGGWACNHQLHEPPTATTLPMQLLELASATAWASWARPSARASASASAFAWAGTCRLDRVYAPALWPALPDPPCQPHGAPADGPCKASPSRFIPYAAHWHGVCVVYHALAGPRPSLPGCPARLTDCQPMAAKLDPNIPSSRVDALAVSVRATAARVGVQGSGL